LNIPLLLLLLLRSSSAWHAGRFQIPRTRIAKRQSTAANIGATGKPAITVVGGTGFVGSRVVKNLVESGAAVTSVSKSGRVPAWCADESWTTEVAWVANDLTRGARENLEAAVGSPDVLVSCVGSVGFDMQGLILGNGIANVAATKAAAKAGCCRFVVVSVASEVAACEGSWLPGFFSGYFKGKGMAEAAMKGAAFNAAGDGGAVCVVRPTFIYGGDSFGLFPPRVTTEYGSGVEELLSSGFFSALAGFMPGLIKVALRPPVSVEAVAGAVAKGALASAGDVMASADLDGTAEINAAAGAPSATGLTDFLSRTSAKFQELKKDK